MEIPISGLKFRVFISPRLVIHGNTNQVVPMEATGVQVAKMLPHATFKVYEGAPHGLFLTEKEKLNQDLMGFLKL